MDKQKRNFMKTTYYLMLVLGLMFTGIVGLHAMDLQLTAESNDLQASELDPRERAFSEEHARTQYIADTCFAIMQEIQRIQDAARATNYYLQADPISVMGKLDLLKTALKSIH